MGPHREKWRFLMEPGGDPAWNMALEEALLLDPQAPPTLRFYTWEPPAISLGYFQDAAEVEPLPPHTGLVRRITGGLAIHHIGELTWGLVLPEARLPGPIEESYRALHQALVDAVQALGAEGVHLREEEVLLSDKEESTPWCFEKSSHLDLVWKGRKLAGSAQRRTKGKLLHHGSVPLVKNPSTPESAWVGLAAKRAVSFEEMARAFGRALEARFEVMLREGELLPEEREQALRLARERHGSPAFVRRSPRPSRRPRSCGIPQDPPPRGPIQRG